jgi:flap endonuclease-1
MGLPVISAPAEGEAQAALLVQRGDAWAVGSQDYDSILFGAPKLVRGLTLSGSFTLELIELENALEEMGLDRSQLIDVALLTGTDFNEGVRGIGPKKGLKAVKEGGLEALLPEAERKPLEEVFLNHPTTEEYDTSFKNPDIEGLGEFLHGVFDFNEIRVKKTGNRLLEIRKQQSQQGLTKWF